MKKEKVIIYGAGWTGSQLAKNLNDSKQNYEPVCFLDDDKEKIGNVLDGLLIYGDRNNIQEAVEKYQANKIIIAMPSVSYKIKRDIYEACLHTGVKVNTIPELPYLMVTSDILSMRKEVKKEDLICRSIVDFETEEIKPLIEKKICLVTGAGGSIGSELSRQIIKHNPSKIILLDVYENDVFNLYVELQEKNFKSKMQIEILSVVDYEACKKVFEAEKIDLIFHAAAHKHVPLMEHNPSEAIKNNIIGTWNMAKLAEEFHVDKMILVSSDKAVNPTNVMGATKRFCEKIMVYFSNRATKTRYAMVRFGNVIGSHGSVFHIFNRQIENGGPVKITHKDIIRYFMTIEEAASLILQCAVYADDGEVFVLDMGEPIKILELAEKMIRLSGLIPYDDIKIEFVGLRPGEKLFEEILMNSETMRKTANGKIYVGKQKEKIETNFEEIYESLISIANQNDYNLAKQGLQKYVETYNPIKN